jgi:hypothetical protein
LSQTEAGYLCSTVQRHLSCFRPCQAAPFPPGRSSCLFEDRLQLAFPDRAFENGMVFLVLVGVGHREGCDSLIKRVALAHVAAEHGGKSGPGMGKSEGPSAPSGEEVHFGTPEGLHADADLHVAQLADKVMAVALNAGAPGPTRGTCRSRAA